MQIIIQKHVRKLPSHRRFYNIPESKFLKFVWRTKTSSFLSPLEKTISMFPDLPRYCLLSSSIKPCRVYQMVDKHIELYRFQRMYVVYQHQLISEMQQVNLRFVIESFPRIVAKPKLWTKLISQTIGNVEISLRLPALVHIDAASRTIVAFLNDDDDDDDFSFSTQSTNPHERCGSVREMLKFVDEHAYRMKRMFEILKKIFPMIIKRI